MAECTDLERELLDSLGTSDGRKLSDLRDRLLVSRMTAEQIERIYATKAAVYRAQAEFNEAWKALPDIHGNGRVFSEFYDDVEREARKRAGAAE